MTRTLSLARVYALGAWVAVIAVLLLSLDVHGWVVACDPARDDNPPDCREAKGSREDRLRMLEELLDEHFRHRAAFDVWELDFRAAKIRTEGVMAELEALPAALDEQLTASFEKFDKGMQDHGYDVEGRVRPNGEDFNPAIWSEDVIVRRVDPSNSDRLLAYALSPVEQVEYLLRRFRALQKGDPGAAVEYWYGAEVTVAVNIAAERQVGADAASDACAAPDACVRMDKLLRDWEAIWVEVLDAFYVETRLLQTEVQKFANRVEGDRASALARLGELKKLKEKYPYEDFSEEEDWLKDVIEDLGSVKRVMAAFERRLENRLGLVGLVASKFSPRAVQAQAALADFDVQMGKHRENSRNLVRISTFLEDRYDDPERLLAGIDQLRYTDVQYYPRPKKWATHLTLQTRGNYPEARYEHARLFFDPENISSMSLCFTGNDISAPCGALDQRMSYAGEVLPPPPYYHMRPFTRNRAYLLYGAGPGPSLDDDVGFARVRVWDDEWSDLSLEAEMTHSYLTLGSWMRAPGDGGFAPQFGAFVSIDDLGLGRRGNPQNVFVAPARAWPTGVKEAIFYGEAEGVYAAGRTPEDTAAGVFTGGVVLIYEQPTTGTPKSGGVSGTIGGPPEGRPDIVVSPLSFTPYYGTDTTPIKPGTLGSLQAGNNRLETVPALTNAQKIRLSLDATQNNAGAFQVTGLANHRGWSSSDPTTIKLENIDLSTGQALGGGKAGILAHGEFQLSGTGPRGQSGPLWKTKSEIANGVEGVVFDLDADGNKQPVLGVVPVALRLDPVHGPEGRWEVGFFNLDHPSTVKSAGIRHGAFAAGVFHLGYNWVLYGGSKGALTGAFAVTPHETSD